MLLLVQGRGQEEFIEIGLHLVTVVVAYILAVARGGFVPARIEGAGDHGRSQFDIVKLLKYTGGAIFFIEWEQRVA